MKRSCAQLHFDVCQERDSANYDCICKQGLALWQYLWGRDGLSTGSWLRLYISSRDAVDEALQGHQEVVCCLAYIRGSDPRLALFLEGDWGRIWEVI